MRKQVTVYLDEEDFLDLHKLMDAKIKVVTDDGNEIVKFKLFKGKKKQEWYRLLLEKGKEKLTDEYMIEEKRLKNQCQDGNKNDN